jgi:hypothetical protein
MFRPPSYASLEADLREASTDLWVYLVDDPDTATGEDEDELRKDPDKAELWRLVDKLSDMAGCAEWANNEEMRKTNNTTQTE